jgi:hypothetical protein
MDTGRARPGVEILTRDLEHPQKFVRAWALDSLATLAQADSALMAVVRRSIRKFERSGSKALASRPVMSANASHLTS